MEGNLFNRENYPNQTAAPGFRNQETETVSQKKLGGRIEHGRNALDSNRESSWPVQDTN